MRSRTVSHEPINDSTPGRRFWAAWSIHSFTASGVLCAMFGLVAIGNSHPETALLWLLVAQIIDGVDGPLARNAEVTKYCPSIDGNVLDLIIDYLTCVVVPVMFMVKFNIFPHRIEYVLAGLILFTSVIWFSRIDIETRDDWFRGFPTGWNLVATSLWLMNLRPEVNSVIAAMFIVLTLTKVKFFHILRSPQFRNLTVAVTTLFITTMALMVIVDSWRDLLIGKIIIVLWLAYYCAMAAWRTSLGDEIIPLQDAE